MPDRAKINFYPFSDGAALHRVGSHRLWVLNHASAVLWCLYEELGDGDELVQAFSAHFHIPVRQAEVEVRKALEQFEDAGLFGSETRSAKREVRNSNDLIHLPLTTHHEPSNPEVRSAKREV